MEPLTATQQKIYDFLKAQIKSKGIAPSIREICDYTGLTSTSTIHLHLSTLEKKGYILRSKTKKRYIEILEDDFYAEPEEFTEYANIPIVGQVSAGMPILAVENIEGHFPVPVDFLRNNDAFMLRIKGDSMINAGILNNDLVLVNKQATASNHDIVIALVDDSATCKRYFKESGHFRLQPENDDYEPIILKEVSILGKVIGLFRSMSF